MIIYILDARCVYLSVREGLLLGIAGVRFTLLSVYIVDFVVIFREFSVNLVGVRWSAGYKESVLLFRSI